MILIKQAVRLLWVRVHPAVNIVADLPLDVSAQRGHAVSVFLHLACLCKLEETLVREVQSSWDCGIPCPAQPDAGPKQLEGNAAPYHIGST